MEMVLSFHGVIGIELKCVKLKQQTLYQQNYPVVPLVILAHTLLPPTWLFIDKHLHFRIQFLCTVELQKETPGDSLLEPLSEPGLNLQHMLSQPLFSSEKCWANFIIRSCKGLVKNLSELNFIFNMQFSIAFSHSENVFWVFLWLLEVFKVIPFYISVNFSVDFFHMLNQEAQLCW